MATYKSTYHEDSDADDEFERSVFVSPSIPADLSPSDTDDMTSPEHTPTTFTHSYSGGSHASPTSLITQWSAEQSAEFLVSLGLGQYAESIKNEAINGEALIEMQHQDLKDMGMTSVGHRLSVLKGVYDMKLKQNVPLDPDHYVPLSAEGNPNDMAATQDDIARVIESIRLRDQRIIAAESELRVLKEDLHRIVEENRKLREETLPIIRQAKDRSQPLPNPEQPMTTPPPDFKPEKTGSGLSRKFSTKKLWLGSAPKMPSPTLGNGPLQDSSSLDPSAAAMAAPSHLTASMTSQGSPNQIQQISPTSPAYSTQAASVASRSFGRTDGSSSARSIAPTSYAEDPHHSFSQMSNHWQNAGPDRSIGNSNAAPRRMAPTPAPGDEPPNSAPLPSSSTIPHRDPSGGGGGGGGGSRERDNIEIFKSFRVSIEDPCDKVLPVALKRYQINDDWRQYALYIVHGDQERCLGLEEKPLMLFKQLNREGRKPMFMLRKHASPAGEGWSSGAASGTARDQGANGRGLPGGVL